MAEIQVRRRTVLDSTRSSSSMALEWMKTSWTLTSTLFSFYLFILLIIFFFCSASLLTFFNGRDDVSWIHCRNESTQFRANEAVQTDSMAFECQWNAAKQHPFQTRVIGIQSVPTDPMRMQWAEPSGQSDGFKHWELDWSVDWSSHGCRITTHRPFPGASSAASRRPSIPLNRVDTSSN